MSVPLGAAGPPPALANPVPLFDGKSLEGWEGNTKLWRVQDGTVTGGSLTETIRQNEFLATKRDFTNFIIRFEIKLTGTQGFINSGFQIRSQRVPNSTEMAGYQCDFGEPNWYGAIYDESRRNKVMSTSDMNALRPVIRKDDWNEYVIRADGPRVTTWINGVQGTDYLEQDSTIVQWGKLGLQVHGGGKAQVQVRKIVIQELPVTPKEKAFLGAPEPPKSARASPLSPEEERAAFTLAPGFEMDLVAAESEGLGKFVAVDWDLQGRLWTMTALEYPVDANENPAAAKELYASASRDKVVVFDRDPASPTGYAAKPRVFAEGLAIPLGILPYKNGVYVQHGSDIVFLSDTDGDGKADKREVILGGFGIQDSHLFPHQFTRAPGNWIWMAQGAFNYGRVRTSRGREIQFDQTRMAKFRYDGSAFDITSQGPCNIWGLAMTAEGETWIQEANDYGYPTMPFHEYANYPGCSNPQWKSYAPEFPGTAPDFAMGGTGLSGLALSDGGYWPEAYAQVMYVANPIVRKIQAIKIHRDGPRYRLQKLADFVQSSDEWFRPVALRLGPDGCLYIVDWYNKIISHNEVPRNHPERDKTRGRIWRVRHQKASPLPVPDFTQLSGDALLAKLGGENTTQSHLAWQAIGDRQLKELAPKLKGIVQDTSQSPAKRIASLWALEALQAADAATVTGLFADANRNVRREAVRAAGELMLPPGDTYLGTRLTQDPEPEVRAEVLRAAGRFLMNSQAAGPADLHRAANAIPVLINNTDLAPLNEPTMKSTHNGNRIKSGDAYDREFERYLVRLFLESKPDLVAEFLGFDSQGRPPENTILATLALEPKEGARELARAMGHLGRAPNQEELLRLAQYPEEPGVGEVLKAILQRPATSTAAMESLLRIRTRLDATKITPLLGKIAAALWLGDGPSRNLALRLTSAFRLDSMESSIHEAFLAGGDRALDATQEIAALRALRELGANQLEGIVTRVKSPNAQIANEAVLTLASSKNSLAPKFLLNKFWNDLSAPQRRSALMTLASSKTGATAILEAIHAGAIPKEDIDGPTYEKLQAVLGDDPGLAALTRQMDSFFRPVLRLDGKNESYVDANLELSGPFTVETWIRLDEDISNRDGLLGAPGSADFNFANGVFRVWCGQPHGDRLIAKKKSIPGAWTHLAVTRDPAGIFRLYWNGELDSTDPRPVTDTFPNLDVGRTIPSDAGTAGALTEFRVWNRARTPDEIRADFDRSFEGEPKPSGLVYYAPGAGPWGKLHGSARIEKTPEFPTLLTAAESRQLQTRFDTFRKLAALSGDPNLGKELFNQTCQACHTVAGQGGQIGPVLTGAGSLGIEALLRNILTPNAAMEPGYRMFRIELKDGDVLDGLLVSQDNDAILLRRQNAEDLRVPQQSVRRAAFTRSSMMPEGLLDALPPRDVSNLFAYLKTLQ